MIRLLDIIFAAVGLLVGTPLFAALCIIGLFDTGSPLFRQERIGKGQRRFKIVKFRTMRKGTLSLATHLVDEKSVTRFGGFLRRTKVDELPQLWNVLVGEMSIVGPRPCLPTQDELIRERVARGVFGVRPGVTGMAQIHGIDMSQPQLLAEVDAQMIASIGVRQYLYYIALTIAGNGLGDRVEKVSTRNGHNSAAR